MKIWNILLSFSHPQVAPFTIHFAFSSSSTSWVASSWNSRTNAWTKTNSKKLNNCFINWLNYFAQIFARVHYTPRDSPLVCVVSVDGHKLQDRFAVLRFDHATFGVSLPPGHDWVSVVVGTPPGQQPPPCHTCSPHRVYWTTVLYSVIATKTFSVYLKHVKIFLMKRQNIFYTNLVVDCVECEVFEVFVEVERVPCKQ